MLLATEQKNLHTEIIKVNRRRGNNKYTKLMQKEIKKNIYFYYISISGRGEVNLFMKWAYMI